MSAWKRRSTSSTPFIRTSGANEGGSSSAPGIGAPPTRTGIVRTPRPSAVSTSIRTKSDGSSRRWPPAALAACTQPGPITTKAASAPAIAVSIASTKSAPASIVSTSMNTASGP